MQQRGRVLEAAGAMTRRAPPPPASDQDEMIILANGDADHHQGDNKNEKLIYQFRIQHFFGCNGQL